VGRCGADPTGPYLDILTTIDRLLPVQSCKPRRFEPVEGPTRSRAAPDRQHRDARPVPGGGRRRAGVCDADAVATGGDAGLAAVLDAFDVGAGDLLGRGGEARVYALDAARVLRVAHPGGRADELVARAALLERLRRGNPPFALPTVLEVGELSGRVFAVERRLPGKPLTEVLAIVDAAARPALVEAYLEAASALGDLPLGGPPSYGELLPFDAIESDTWAGYLERRAAANLAGSSAELRRVDAAAVARTLPEAAAPAFVHLDAFAGNMLTDGAAVTAVLDIGTCAVAGDRRFNVLAAACYLEAPEITPTATAADAALARRWLDARGLGALLGPTRRWLAAYWSAAVDDAALLRWCRRVLLGG